MNISPSLFDQHISKIIHRPSHMFKNRVQKFERLELWIERAVRTWDSRVQAYWHFCKCSSKSVKSKIWNIRSQDFAIWEGWAVIGAEHATKTTSTFWLGINDILPGGKYEKFCMVHTIFCACDSFKYVNFMKQTYPCFFFFLTSM